MDRFGPAYRLGFDYQNLREEIDEMTMTVKDLKERMTQSYNDIVFTYGGKRSVITAENRNQHHRYQIWHGNNTKTYDDAEELLSDPVFSGSCLKDVAETICFSIL